MKDNRFVCNYCKIQKSRVPIFFLMFHDAAFRSCVSPLFFDSVQFTRLLYLHNLKRTSVSTASPISSLLQWSFALTAIPFRLIEHIVFFIHSDWFNLFEFLKGLGFSCLPLLHCFYSFGSNYLCYGKKTRRSIIASLSKAVSF